MHDDLPQLQHFGKHVEYKLGLECEWSWHDRVDIAHGGDSKGKRLTKWVGVQGWPMEDVVAFGDNFNDTSVPGAVDTGVAMGSVDDAVKARANTMIGDNITDSIARFIYSHLI